MLSCGSESIYPEYENWLVLSLVAPSFAMYPDSKKAFRNMNPAATCPYFKFLSQKKLVRCVKKTGALHQSREHTMRVHLLRSRFYEAIVR